MEAKKKLFEVNIMENKKFVWGLNILAVALIFPFAFVFGMIVSWLIANGSQYLELTVSEVWLLFPLYILLIVVHEAIHGIFFKVFCPENPVNTPADCVNAHFVLVHIDDEISLHKNLIVISVNAVIGVMMSDKVFYTAYDFFGKIKPAEHFLCNGRTLKLLLFACAGAVFFL